MEPKQEVKKKEINFAPIKFGLATLGVIATAATCIGIAVQIHGTPNGGVIALLVGVALGLIVGTIVTCSLYESDSDKERYRY